MSKRRSGGTQKKGKTGAENRNCAERQEGNAPGQEPTGSDDHQPAPGKSDNRCSTKQNSKPKLEIWSLAVQFIIGICAFGALIFNAVQACIAIRAVKVSEDAVGIARDGMTAANRAWIIVTDAAKLDLATNTPPPKLTIKNAGNSPAIIEKYWVNRVVRMGQLHRPDNPTDGPYRGFGNAVVGPGLTFDMAGDLPPINAMSASLIHDKAVYLYFVGSIEYSDPFGTGRRTDFCFYWTPIDWSACPGANTLK